MRKSILKKALTTLLATAGLACSEERQNGSNYLNELLKPPITSSVPDTFSTDESPQEYVETFHSNNNIFLDDFIADASQVFPKSEDERKDRKIFISYITSKTSTTKSGEIIDWCLNCPIVRNQDFLKTTLDAYGSRITLTKTEVPEESSPPILDKIHEGGKVPDIREVSMGMGNVRFRNTAAPTIQSS